MTEIELDDLEAGLDGEVPVYRLQGALYSGRVRAVDILARHSEVRDQGTRVVAGAPTQWAQSRGD